MGQHSDSCPSNTIRNFNGRTIQALNKIPFPVCPEKGIDKGVSTKSRRRANMRGAPIESMLLAEATLNKSDQRVHGVNLVVALGTQLNLIVLGNT